MPKTRILKYCRQAHPAHLMIKEVIKEGVKVKIEKMVYSRACEHADPKDKHRLKDCFFLTNCGVMFSHDLRKGRARA
jgi:hypothetical protein